MTTVIAGLVPRLRRHPHTDLAGRAAGPVDLGVTGHDVADMYRDDELEFVNNSRNDSPATVARCHDTGGLIDQAHDRATVHVALQVCVERVDDTTEPDS